jgi:dipeptidyl aminopeptidase/acylaminoacyl peptidase
MPRTKITPKTTPKITPQSGRHLTPELIWQLDRVGAPSLSPDGRRAVCSVTSYDVERNEGRAALWLLSTTGAAPRQLTSCGSRDGQPLWSPRGDRIAFLARREQEGEKDNSAQLYTIAPDGGESQRFSHFGPGIESFKWLPDGQRIVFSAWVWPDAKNVAEQDKRHKAWRDRKETGYVTSSAFYRHWDHHVPMGRALHLLLLDLASGRITDLFAGTGLELPRDGEGAGTYDVRPDGRAVAFAHDPAPDPRAGNRLVLSEIQLRTRQVTPLADDKGWDFGAPRYSPDGTRLAALGAHIAKTHTAPAQLVLLEPGKKRRVVGVDWDHNMDGPLRWSADSRAVFFTAEDRGRCHLWRRDLATQALARVHEGGWVQGWDVVGSPGGSPVGNTVGDTVAVLMDRALHPAQIWAHRGAEPARRVEHFNDERLAGVSLGELREISVRGAQGDQVQVWLTFPPGFDPKRKHAVTHVIHGGPFAAAGDTFGFRWNTHVFAAAGHVIAQVNFHGSSGFGHAFRHSLIGRQGELELQDIEATTDWLLEQPWADKSRVFATGGSYGGFLVAWMNGHVPAWPAGRYRAYVCHAGVFDRIATFSADSYPVRPKDLAANYWDDMPRVLAQSPHASAANMHTPTLVIHGAQDYRVPDCNGLAYYNTLKARGVDARLLWFPDENHWVLKPRNSLLWYREFADWLVRHGGRKPPGANTRAVRAARS